MAREPAASRSRRRVLEVAALLVSAAVVVSALVYKGQRAAPATSPSAARPAVSLSGALPGGAAPAPAASASTGEGCFVEDHGMGDYVVVPAEGGRLFVRRGAVQDSGSYRLVVHFHAGEAVRRLLAPVAWDFNLFVVDAGNGSAVYRSRIPSRAAFDALVAGADRAIAAYLGREARASSVIVSSFSAGYGAVAAVAAKREGANKIDGIILLDSLHASYAPSSREPDQGSLRPFVEAARAAKDGDGFFMAVTHSAIVPPDYASTTECCAALEKALGVKEEPVGWAGEVPLPPTGQLRVGRLVMTGYAGSDQAAHCNQLRLLPGLMRELATR